MTKLAVIAKGSRIPLKVILAAAVAFQTLLAQESIKSSILQNTADEQEVRQRTAALVAQVQALIDELAANGISGEDTKVLETTKTVLNNLSSKQMEQVIASLQKAGATSGTTAGSQNAVDAYAGQKGVILVFRQILKDYEQRQAAMELPARFKELTDRQTQNMWTTAKVAADSAGKNAAELTGLQQTTQQIAQTDQDALNNDVAMTKQQLDKAVEGATGDEGNALKQAQADLKAGKLQTALDQASADLKAGHLLQATGDQKLVRDALAQVTKDLSPAATMSDALAANAAALAKIIEDQKSLLDETNSGAEVRPRPTGLDLKQGMLVDQTNTLQSDMQSFSAPAAGLVKDAINPMQLSRSLLGPRGGAFAKAAASQQDAIDKLEEAEKQMQQQVADAQKAETDAAKDPVAKLQDLQKQLQTAMQEQQQVAQATTAAANAPQPNPAADAQDQQAQGQVQQQTSAMQQSAQPLSVPAAQALANAAKAMTQAQQDMTDPSQAANAQADQQAAQAALAQANQAVNQQIASTQAATADPAALAAAANALNNAQSDVSNAIADSTPPAGSPAASPASPSAPSNPPSSSPSSASPPPPGSASNPSTASTPPAAGTPAATPPSMADANAALAAAAKATADAAATPGLPAAAASAVQSAQTSIAAGQQAAAKGDAPATAAAAAAAQASLASAQAAVAVAQAGMPSSGPPGPPGAPGTPGMPGPPGPPGPDQTAMDGAKSIGGGSTDKGTLHDVAGNGKFITVTSRDRTAIDQTQSEKRPQEYAPMIDQYMKNLADQSSSSSP